MRVLEVVLGSALEVRRRSWACSDPALYALGSGSGAALATSLSLAEAGSYAREELPFVIAVGDAVRRALPTAARASLLSRAPLTGRVAQGQVGGELGRRLAAVCDALVIRGRALGRPQVLVIDALGEVQLRADVRLEGSSPARAGQKLHERFGPCASLRVGPAARAGLPYANLATGHEHQSFVGRGGLGAAFAAHGLDALVVCAAARADCAGEDSELAHALAASPRLIARGEGGTLELFEAFAAGGREFETPDGSPLPRIRALALAQGARERRRERHGCRGCPTPCGWEFAGPGGASSGAHFSAALPLGPALGLADFGQVHQLVACCDELGLDAKEAGAALSVLSRAREQRRIAGEPVWGDLPALTRLLVQAVQGTGEGARLAAGSEALAAELGVESGAARAQGEAARRDGDLAALLGQCVATRGAEPMRSFPFVVSDGVPRDRARRLLDPLPLPEAAFDPRSPVAKGRLVWWHESFVTAVDATGFCAFSAAGVLSDGRMGLDELAEEITPEAWRRARPDGRPGERLLGFGAQLLAAFRALNEHIQAPDSARPGWAADALAMPGMLDEYQSLRDESTRGLAAGESFFTAALRLLGKARPASSAPATDSQPTRSMARIEVRAVGPLRRFLEPDAELEMPLPAPLLQVLEAATRRWPEAAPWILRDGEAVPTVYREGRGLAATEEVRAGDVLDLVSVVSGG